MNLKGTVQITKTRGGKKVWESPEMKNLIVLSEDHGANLIIQRLGGNNQFSLNITHGDIGTGDSVPEDGDTTVEGAVSRAVVLKTQKTNDSVTFRFFFPDGLLPNGTYKKFGTFIDGDSSVDTGQMWNNILFPLDYVKSTGEDTTIRVTFSADN